MEKDWELTRSLPNQMNQEIINEFLLNLKLKNRSDGTITNYRYFLERFFGDQKEPYSSLTSHTIQQWFITQQSRIKESTHRYRLKVLASFYLFCIKEKYISQSPITSRMYPRLPYHRRPQLVPKFLMREDVAKTGLTYYQYVEKEIKQCEEQLNAYFHERKIESK